MLASGGPHPKRRGEVIRLTQEKWSGAGLPCWTRQSGASKSLLERMGELAELAMR